MNNIIHDTPAFITFTEEEVIKSYNCAKNKRKQIKILSELCTCSTKAMCVFLGLNNVPKKYNNIRDRTPYNMIEIEAMRKLKYRWEDIGAYYGTTESSVCKWYHKHFKGDINNESETIESKKGI